jgi:hypothetical protein
MKERVRLMEIAADERVTLAIAKMQEASVPNDCCGTWTYLIDLLYFSVDLLAMSVTRQL